VLHNAAVAWNALHVRPLVDQLRAEGHEIGEAALRVTTPLMPKHINLIGEYDFDVNRMRQAEESPEPVTP
jgi:hypothetical protein